MGRSRDDRNEYGGKNRVKIKISGIFVERDFRSEGEARKYLAELGYVKEHIKRGIVKIIRN